jgi:uncharacterized membrane protein YuzA (DUF378 family)
MSLTLIDRFHPRLRREQQATIDAGKLIKCDELALLETEQLRPLASLSLILFGISAIFFVALNIAAYEAWYHRAFGSFSALSIIVWIVINILGYIIILPLHEVIHGLVFAFWGGKPYFGAKLPLALFCGAKNQLFHRNQYLVVGLAPLVVITLAGILFTLLAPGLAAYTLLATTGNFSGAAGDIWVARRISRQSRETLVEDTETGYRAWEISV